MSFLLYYFVEPYQICYTMQIKSMISSSHVSVPGMSFVNAMSDATVGSAPRQKQCVMHYKLCVVKYTAIITVCH